MTMRTETEVATAENDLFEQLWYIREKMLEEVGEIDQWPEDQQTDARGHMARIEAKFGPIDRQRLPVIEGKLSAIRWVLGSEWDALDT